MECEYCNNIDRLEKIWTSLVGLKDLPHSTVSYFLYSGILCTLLPPFVYLCLSLSSSLCTALRSLWPFCPLFSCFLSRLLSVFFSSQFQVICPASWGEKSLCCSTHTKTNSLSLSLSLSFSFSLSLCRSLSLSHSSQPLAPANALQHYYSTRS